MSLTTRPLTPAPAHDLTDAEFAELNDLLEATPEPLEPLDTVMLDGYLCGVLVLPVLLVPATWLPFVFDAEGRPLPDEVDPAWLQRTTALILRRHAALNREIAEEGGFDPLLPMIEADAALPELADVAVEADAEAEAETEAEANRNDDDDDATAGLSPISKSLMPWVLGFHNAMASFPDLDDFAADEVLPTLMDLYRHLPAENDEAREIIAALDRDHPQTTLDDAIGDMVEAVVALYELTREQRYKVETVKREAPKVGRNDPCPCGSGKKFKVCHGGG